MTTSDDSSVLLVLGLDADGKPHGSRFNETDSALVEKAAGLMGFSVARVTEPELRQVAAKLPEGRVFGSGKAFVPFIKRSVYDQLATAIADPPQYDLGPGSEDDSPSQASDLNAEQDEGGTELPPDPWSEISVGEEVLCRDDEGWWEAVVVETAGPDQPITVRWRDFPKEPRFTVPRRNVAVIGPDAR